MKIDLPAPLMIGDILDFPNLTRQECVDNINRSMEEYEELRPHLAIGYIFPYDERVEIDMRTLVPIRVVRQVDVKGFSNPCEEISMPGIMPDFQVGYQRHYMRHYMSEPGTVKSEISTESPACVKKPKETKAFQRYQTERDIKVNINRPRLVLQRNGRYKLQLSDGRWHKKTSYKSRSNRPASQQLHAKRTAEAIKTGYIFPIDEQATVDIHSYKPLRPGILVETWRTTDSCSHQFFDYQRELYQYLCDGHEAAKRPVTTTGLFDSLVRVAQDVK